MEEQWIIDRGKLRELSCSVSSALTKVFHRKHRYHYPLKLMEQFGAKMFWVALFIHTIVRLVSSNLPTDKVF